MRSIILSLVMLVISASPAFCCGKCGIFGRGCRFASHAPVHHVPHVEKAVVREASVQNFVFNNIAPAGDLAPRGDTIYGLSRALDYNAPSSALYQDNLRRLIDLGTELTVSSRDLDSNLTRALEIDAKGRAIEAGFRALASDTTTETRSRSVKVTIREDGTPDITHLDEPQGVPREAPPSEVLGQGGRREPANVFWGLGCIQCHGSRDPKGGVTLSGVVGDDLFKRAALRVTATDDEKLMPPPKDGQVQRFPAGKLQPLFREAEKRGIDLTLSQ